MPTRLTLSQQRALVKALPHHRISAVKKHCQACQMKGQGIMSILKSIGSVLGPIVKEVGPTVLKELVVPFIKKKMNGKGLTLPGGGLKLAGQRGLGIRKGTKKSKRVPYKMPKEYYM